MKQQWQILMTTDLKSLKGKWRFLAKAKSYNATEKKH